MCRRYPREPTPLPLICRPLRRARTGGPTGFQRFTRATLSRRTSTRVFHRDHLAARLAATLATPTFRPYLADDVIGVEVGGAVKNVLAIACGIAAGRGMGSAPTVAALARAHDVSMPICQAVCDIVEGRSIDDAIAGLLMSDLRPEPLQAEADIRIPQAAAPAREWEFASA